MEVRPLDESTLVAEALCGKGRLLAKSELTEDEKLTLRAAEIKARWLERMMAKGLAARLAFEAGVSVGFIEYMPIELSNFHKGRDLYCVNCMVAPHTPPWTKTQAERIPGCGTALVHAMVENLKDKCSGVIGASAIAYTNIAGFFARLGFEEYEHKGSKWLIRKFGPFEPPEHVVYEDGYRFQPVQGKVVVDTFWSSLCTSSPRALVMLRDICKEFGGRVTLNEHCLDERTDMDGYGEVRCRRRDLFQRPVAPCPVSAFKGQDTGNPAGIRERGKLNADARTWHQQRSAVSERPVPASLA